MQRAISIHALLAESDFGARCGAACVADFYPRSPCGERPGQLGGQRQPPAISIHALLAESDPGIQRLVALLRQFLSTLSLRRATRLRFCWARLLAFLSTLSLRRATWWLGLEHPHPGNFYPRSPCGERPIRPAALWCSECISIHALLAESDIFLGPSKSSARNFYPRSPCGERRSLR